MIHKHLEKILDDLGEALILMRNVDNEVTEEMASLFLVKRRMVDLVESCFCIYQELVKIRLCKTENKKECSKEENRTEDYYKKKFLGNLEHGN